MLNRSSHWKLIGKTDVLKYYFKILGKCLWRNSLLSKQAGSRLTTLPKIISVTGIFMNFDRRFTNTLKFRHSSLPKFSKKYFKRSCSLFILGMKEISIYILKQRKPINFKKEILISLSNISRIKSNWFDFNREILNFNWPHTCAKMIFQQ